MPMPTKAPTRIELASRPLHQATAAIPRLLAADGGQQELTQPPALTELMDAAFRDPEHPRDVRDGAAGGEDISDLERAIRNVETARTRLRLATLVLSDLLGHHAAAFGDD